MLNGVDLRARQALAEQIREDSWEAQLSLGVAAHTAVADRCRVRTEPMRLGSTRVARTFGIDQRCGSGADDCLDPVGSLLVALGASVADSVVTELTEQGCSPALLEVLPCVEFARDGDAARLAYEIRLGGNVPVEQARRALAAARERGSAHRTLEEPNDIKAVVQTAQDVHLTSRPVLPGTEPFVPERRRAARVMWEVGTHVLAEVDGVHAESDQPKQLFGADLAPSAQEYFLAALAAEALGFADPARATAAPDKPPVSAHASGRIDLRGPYSTQIAPAGLRNILVQLLPADPTADGNTAVRNMRRWLAGGPALRLVRDAHPIEVRLVLNGTPAPAQHTENDRTIAANDTKE
ncbi:hypothetical protein K2224_15800 [Streptomyces sp. BHT-5-2]|uniref:hypothetical protein n=1 Tax=unclassified Streptomyces TaxID=2593676 RepID=UPI001C8E17C4|nr:hypothetical protein [Streptomyces sp. BHT-5-2]QZL04454.1 hypothetical protein K2224_15800 [Streptomyces sp. BHT-5-2]